MTRAWLVTASLLLVACGDTTDTMMMMPPTPGTATEVLALEWSAGDSLGLVLLDRQTKNPATLRTDDVSCSLTQQVGTALESGGVVVTDREGPCFVTEEVGFDLTGRESTIAPACAGLLSVRYGDVARTVNLCDGPVHAPPANVDCDVAQSASLSVQSGNEEDNDVVPSIDVTVPPAERPTVMSPVPQGEGNALWPDSALLVGWGGVGAEAIEIIVSARTGGATLRCHVPDTGSFTIPERLVAPYRAAPAYLEVRRIEQATSNASADFRVSTRTNDVIWLNLRGG